MSNTPPGFYGRDRSGKLAGERRTPPKAPSNAHHFVANYSDLTGPTNPAGILSPQFLRLKRALDRGSPPAETLQALYIWLKERKVSPEQADAILALPSAAHAYDALIDLIGAGLGKYGLPEVARQTLKRTIALIAGNSAEAARYQGALAQGYIKTIKDRFGMESAAAVVRRLLAG